MSGKRLISILGLILLSLVFSSVPVFGESLNSEMTHVGPAPLDPRPIGNWFKVSQPGAVEGHGFEEQSSISFDTCSGTYLVTWRRRTSVPNTVIFGQQIDRNGSLLGAPFLISAGTGNQTDPDVTFEQSTCRWLVVFQIEGSGIYARRVNSNGTVYGSVFPIAVNASGEVYSLPVVAYGGGVSLIAYSVDHDPGIGPHDYAIKARNILPSTIDIGAAVTVEGPTGTAAISPDITFSPIGDFLIVWEMWGGTTNKNNIYGKGYTVAAGDLLPVSARLDLFTLADDVTKPSVGGIAWGSSPIVGQYLVAASKNVGGTNYPVAQLVSDGFSMTGSSFYLNMENGTDTAVVGSRFGKDYEAIWCQTDSLNFFIRAARVGNTPGSVGTVLNLGGAYALNPAIEAGAGGEFLVTQDDMFTGEVDIFGKLLGQRIYLPVTLK